MSKFKDPNSKNSRKRLTENASASRIAEANDVWHSTAIEEMEEEDIGKNGLPFLETPIKGKKAKVVTSDRKGKDKENDRDSGRGQSSTRDPTDLDHAPVVINPPSGHSFFSSVLQKCGYIIRQPVANNELFHDSMKFRKNLSDWIADNNDEMSRIETDASKFFKALDAYLLDKSNFMSSMRPTKHETELIQDSLLHALLGIEAIQARVLKTVFYLLAEASLSNSEENVSEVSTILSQLKWLPIIVDGQKFLQSFMSIISNASQTCQSLIVKFLPDILPTHLHFEAAEKLLEMFNDDGPHLNIALMDCFSSLDISDDLLSNIRLKAIDQMATAALKDMPAYFSFLFRSESANDIDQVITAIREKVTLVPEHRSAKTDAHQIEILEKVEFCIIVNPAITKIWTRQIKHDIINDLSADLKKIDLLMLFICAESDETQVFPTLKMLFGEKQIVLKLFDELMRENTPMVYRLFSTIANLLDKFLRGHHKCLDVVADINVRLFVGLSAIEAQTLMGNMTSILVNYPPSRNIVLHMLTMLAEKSPKKLLFFAPYLMGVLEEVMQFPAGQIRTLMNVLAILSQTEGKNPGESNHFNAEFSILLRKQLTHSDIKIRCFGVYGALASVRQMALGTVPNEIKIRELLKLAWNFVERDEDACSIFLDELSTCVKTLPLGVCQTYRDILKTKFQQLWTLDELIVDQRIAQLNNKENLKFSIAFDANKECTEERLLITFEDQPLSMSSLVVPAHMRTLALLESKIESNNLVGIDAILGCPILIPDLQEYYERDSISDLKYNQRYHLGQYLVLAINFLRESICAFVKDENKELRVKVWLRLENILKLQMLLVKHFDSFPALPYAYVAEKTIGSSKDIGAGPSRMQAFRFPPAAKKSNKTTAKPGVAKPKAAPKKSAKKKAKTDQVFSESESENEAGNAANAGASNAKKGALSLDEQIQPKKLQPYLRRFDKFVFYLLRNPLRGEDEHVSLSRILLDISSVTQSSATISQVETFIPETLVLLLVELRRQVQDQPSSINILKVKGLLTNVCKLMHQIHNVILKNEENDMAAVTEYQTKLECCLRILIEILTSYFEAIKKLEKSEAEKFLTKTIETLTAQAVNQQSSDEDINMHSQTEVLHNVANYLASFVSVIKDSSTALDHLKLIKNLHDLLDVKTEFKKAIDNAAGVYLRTDWKLPSAKVDGFLKIWLGTATQPLKVIKHLSEKLLSCEDNERDEETIFNSSVYKSCSTTNFQTWYTAMLSGLSQYVYKNLRKRGDFDDNIREWREVVEIFRSLVNIAKKEFKSKNLKNFILTALLKNCRMFLDAFISGGAELLPQYMKQNSDEAQKFCKSLQAPCRIIQHICDHSKIHTDLQLLKSVPQVKRVLETLVFRVREVLGNAGAVNAFWMGTLKHRDLRGRCISSQIMEGVEDIGSDDESNDEEEIQAAPLSGMTEHDLSVNEDSMDVDNAMGTDED